MIRYWPAAFLILPLLGCAALMQSSAKAEFRPSPSAPAGVQPVPAEQVQVFELTDSEAWPEGISLQQGQMENKADHVVIATDYPSPEAPHRKLGAVVVELDQGDRRRVDAKKLLREEAGRRGANAIVVVVDGWQGAAAVAILLSDAQPHQNFPSAARALEDAVNQLTGYRRGPEAAIELSSVDPVLVEGRRGTCYALAWGLEPSTDLSREARAILKVTTQSSDLELDRTMRSFPHNLSRSTRSASLELGCPQTDGPIQIGLGTPAVDKPSPAQPLGLGPATLLVLTRSISEKELQERAASRAASWKKSDEDRSQRIRQQCFSCSHHLSWCDHPQSCDRYRSCLARIHVRVDECGH